MQPADKRIIPLETIEKLCNNQLFTLNLSGKRLTSQHVNTLCQKLQGNHTLAIADLYGTPLTLDDIKKLSPRLAEIKSLTTLKLVGTKAKRMQIDFAIGEQFTSSDNILETDFALSGNPLSQQCHKNKLAVLPLISRIIDAKTSGYAITEMEMLEIQKRLPAILTIFKQRQITNIAEYMEKVEERAAKLEIPFNHQMEDIVSAALASSERGRG